MVTYGNGVTIGYTNKRVQAQRIPWGLLRARAGFSVVAAVFLQPGSAVLRTGTVTVRLTDMAIWVSMLSEPSQTVYSPFVRTAQEIN